MKPDRSTKTVSFRIAAMLSEQLEAEAAKNRLSPGEYARDLVLRALSGDQQRQIQDQLAKLDARLNRLEKSLALATIALLADAGKAEKEEAEDWVRANLLQ